MHVISNPAIPFWGHIPEGVHPGLVIHIDGHIPHHADKFSINLVKGSDVGHHASHHSSIALHLNPRLNEDYIVLNSRHHKDWQHEDRHHHTHTLHRGHGFSITIHVESQYYRISVNGQHLCNFDHRMPYHEVGALWIDGNIDVRSIEYRREHGGQGAHFVPGYTPTSVYQPAHFEPPHGHHHESHHHDHHHHGGHHNY